MCVSMCMCVCVCVCVDMYVWMYNRLKIETRLIDERFVSVIGECMI